jgi:hypothetical protein
VGRGGVGAGERRAISQRAFEAQLVEATELDQVQREDRYDKQTDGDERGHWKSPDSNKLNRL